MIILPCNQPTYFDVDDTLVKWFAPDHEKEKHGIKFDRFGVEGLLVPHKKHIEQLKIHKLRGHTVVVWSAGGHEWAEAVVKALGIEQYVDLVIEKPMWHYDDLDSSEFMGKRYYYDDEP